jgi:hypothetical protein
MAGHFTHLTKRHILSLAPNEQLLNPSAEYQEYRSDPNFYFFDEKVKIKLISQDFFYLPHLIQLT